MSILPIFVRAVVVLLVLACAQARAAGNLANLDRDNGLPDAQLGAPLASFPGMVKTEDVGRWLTYKRSADKLRYGKYEVTGITYNFFKERLYSINLDIRGKGNVGGIIKLLEKNYGEDHTEDALPFAKINDYMGVREWSSSRVYCVMKSSSDGTGGVLTLVDRPTWDMLQVPKKEKLKANQQKLMGSFVNGDLDKKEVEPAAPAPTPAPQPPTPGTDPGSLPGNPLLPAPKP